MPEWPKGTGCKPVGVCLRWFESISPHHSGYAGVAQLVEHQPSKLRVASSNLVSRSIAHVAQLVERILGKDEVTGSNPVMGSSHE
jgi:hypothetical protein